MVIATATAACNTLSGGHDRFLDDSDAARVVKPFADGGGADVTDEPPVTVFEAGTTDSEAGIVFIDVSRAFTSINGASYATSPAGIEITNYDGGATHPIIVPAPQPTIPSDDYTVYATVKAPIDEMKGSEWGILTRVQPGGVGGYALGSKFGADPKPFLGSIAPPDWNPSLDTKSSTAWVFVANARYNFMLKVVGNFVSGKMWDASLKEPPDFQVTHLAPWSTGRAIGYYNYIPTGGNGAVLESMRVSVP